eukprot:4487886-Pleurochrysis_carterae.AAC.1
MAKKEYNDQYPKSIALTLRMCQPYFSSIRVAPRMLWTGADCGLVVRVRGVRARPFRHRLFAAMSVKTAHKDYPKAVLLAE